MRQVIINILIIGVLALGWFYLSSTYTFSIAPTPTPEASVTATPSPTPTPTQAPPQSIAIPKLSINSAVEPVGTDVNHQMQVPGDWGTVGWFSQGTKPGEIGTAIFSGHYDNQLGQPAVFYYLKSLEAGDEISVVDQTGKTMVFSVTEVNKYPNDSVIEQFVKDNGEANLILITCAGWWNSQAHNYSHRLVVYAKLKGK